MSHHSYLRVFRSKLDEVFYRNLKSRPPAPSNTAFRRPNAPISEPMTHLGAAQQIPRGSQLGATSMKLHKSHDQGGQPSGQAARDRLQHRADAVARVELQ